MAVVLLGANTPGRCVPEVTAEVAPRPRPDERLPRCVGRGREAQILAWARDYRAKKGKRRSADSPPEGLPQGESWKQLDVSLRRGQRGLPGGSSLSRLLRRRR